ncbi:MAG: SAVED domain-containing protein [Bacteroidetes bacterium]|nr:SAVED domain-containing protein [Bacteroidota bacterium]
MKNEKKVMVIIAHYGLDRKITKEECEAALEPGDTYNIFIDFEAGNAKLGELYDLPFENLALAQQRKFLEIVKPVLDENPSAHIAYFGFTPISIAFHFGYLIGNTHPYTIYQWHHKKSTWFYETEAPYDGYEFMIKPIALPQEMQRGKGNVVIRIGTSFSVDRQSTNEIIDNPENEFDIELFKPDIDSLYSQKNIGAVVDAFQEVLNTYSNKLSGREQIHLFISSSVGLPFALGTRVNTNIYPFIQTYQYDRRQAPKHIEAILISKEEDLKIRLTEDEKNEADKIRKELDEQLQNRLKPFIKAITGNKSDNWLQTVCGTSEEYQRVNKLASASWSKVIDIGATSLKDDSIDLNVKNIDGGFEYIEKTNTWSLDDGFLAGLQKRLAKNKDTDLMQAGRLFFFHESLHYSKDGHRLTSEIANGIGQFPKVIEEADYQADVWALLTEYRYGCMYQPEKLKKGMKEFFCNAIDTAVETMWSFMDTGRELNSIQIRSMNRFINWYWQWVLIEDLPAAAKLEDVASILFNKPAIEFAGATMELRGHKTFYKLSIRQKGNLQLAAFVNNRVHRFAPATIDDIVSGFRSLKGEKIKSGLKSFQVSV